ncbi:hypothetical protein HN51_054947 [Arachis hypogaea]|uniref:uncharacterized protein n=1 Tax=Arachis hypogaea TaxID=3818 RepID=UPI000DED4CBE|nr:uncharacterized protein LOC112775105 [Arachis hypogaea]XP_025674374.1 uncharacterized protein LOC112775118 [Arachis hypogaea]
MKNSMLYFSFALLYTFLLSTHVLTHEIPNNEERIPAQNNNAWPYELEGSTSGYHLPSYYFQEANPSLVPNAKKGHYTTRLVGYTPSDYQLDKTMIDISFPGGRINFPWPFSSSMFVAPKTDEASPLYTATSTSYHRANQYPSYFGDTENPKSRRMTRNRKLFMMEPSEVNEKFTHIFPTKTSNMIHGGKGYGDIDEATTT